MAPDRFTSVTDSRAAANVIGALVLFAFLIIAVSLYQAQVVPQDNQQVEFSHNLEVQDDMSAVRNAILDAASTGEARSIGVDLGTRYQPRTFFRNPPPPSGRLSATQFDRPVTIVNAQSVGDTETGDYWNGDSRSIETGVLEYEPNYNRYRAAPTTVYESTLVYNSFAEEKTRMLAPQRLVRGTDITLIGLTGEFSTSRNRPVTISPEAASPETRRVTLEAAGGPITITAPTTLGEAAWEDALNDEDHVESVTVADGVLTVTLDESATYDLRMAKVGLEQQAQTTPRYITDVGRSGDRFTVEVRDTYNNPKSGVEVTVSTNGVQQTVKETDSDGRVSYDFSGTGTLSFRIPGGGDEREVVFDVDPVTSPNGDGGPIDVTWTAPNGGDDFTFDAGADDDGQVTLTAQSDPAVEDLDVEYVVNNSSVGTIAPPDSTTNDAGATQTTFEALANGTVSVYALGGGGGDVINITVTNVGEGDLPGGEPVVGNPAQAFDDADDDGALDANERTIATSQLYDFDNTSVNLVIPEAVGELEQRNDPVSIRARSITSEVDFSSTNKAVTLEATAGEVLLDSRIEAKKSSVDISGTRVDVSGASINGQNDGITLTANGDELIASGAQLSASKSTVDVSGKRVDVSGANIDATNRGITLAATDGELVASGALLSASKSTVDISGKRVDVSGANIDATNQGITLSATVSGGGELIASNALLSADKSDIALESVGDIFVDGATLQSRNGRITADLGGAYTLHLSGTVVQNQKGPGAIQYTPDGVTEDPDRPIAEPQ
ncbi:hypothetical protein N0B31_11325 [Salinirubellus salinus]|uniref:Uncharacterized protein n=1 Tax=Salinirubellus salinus TaxID=1364945 RepID=A0A9E7U965_9EURY|nr:hypothetical protein [Salinirubellus salinus]UWM52742.1 hypothetical protein N0B31_11325 [Salinirubellus salinus]